MSQVTVQLESLKGVVNQLNSDEKCWIEDEAAKIKSHMIADQNYILAMSLAMLEFDVEKENGKHNHISAR